MKKTKAKGAVAAGHAATAEAAAFALREGGNAFDAVIAAHWTACVAEPVLTSLGGGGFLLAQPQSGPACVYTTPSASREAVLPITLQMAIVLAPAFFARRIAARVSAVSPD